MCILNIPRLMVKNRCNGKTFLALCYTFMLLVTLKNLMSRTKNLRIYVYRNICIQINARMYHNRIVSINSDHYIKSNNVPWQLLFDGEMLVIALMTVGKSMKWSLRPSLIGLWKYLKLWIGERRQEFPPNLVFASGFPFTKQIYEIIR